MNDLARLMDLTATIVEALWQCAAKLESEPQIRARDSVCRKLDDAVIALIAQVAQAQDLASPHYSERVHAMSALRGARASAREIKAQVCVCVARRYVAAETAVPVLEKADEAMALLLALTVAGRGSYSLMAA